MPIKRSPISCHLAVATVAVAVAIAVAAKTLAAAISVKHPLHKPMVSRDLFLSLRKFGLIIWA